MGRDRALHAERIATLQQTALFGGIRDDIVAFLLERAARVDVRAGDYFFREDDPGDAVYLLESGRAEILKGQAPAERRLRELRPGDCFGEMSLIDFSPRSASVRAVEDSGAIALSAEALHRLYERDVEQFAMIEMNMGREVSRRLRQHDDAASGDGGNR